MKKLVKKTDDGWLTEIDEKAMRREALLLRQCINEASASEKAEFNYDEWLRPVLKAALDGTIQIPYRGQPYNIYMMMDGMLPRLPKRVESLYFAFLSRIKGTPELSSCSTLEGGKYDPGASQVIIDGEKYEWVIFED